MADFQLTSPVPEEDKVSYVDATVVRVSLQKSDSGWTVMTVDRGGVPESWVGVMPEMSDGLPVRAQGEWENGKWGKQFRVRSIVVRMPEATDPDALARFIAKLGVPGLGEAISRRIVNALGAETISVMESTDLSRLIAVKGVSEAMANELSRKWQKHAVEGNILVGLERYGIRGALAKRVYRKYASKSLEVCEKHPYELGLTIDGIGFKTADKIAAAVGIARESIERIEAGVIYVMSEDIAKRGHCYADVETLVAKASHKDRLDLDEMLIPDGITRACERGYLVREGDKVFLSELYLAEVRVANRLVRLLRSPAKLRIYGEDQMEQHDMDREHDFMMGALGSLEFSDGRHFRDLARAPLPEHGEQVRTVDMAPPSEELAGFAERAIVEFERQTGFELAELQRKAVRTAMSEKVLIITGGPGCGKTATSRAVLHALEMAGFRIGCCAPTGRAAKRLMESTGREASTIHRFLEYKPSDDGKARFHRTPGNPLEETAVLADEMSMTDISLMANLLDALDDGARIVIVGDVDQLPSVGPGAVLRDLIESETIPVVRLNQVFRQAQGSKIITNAHRVNNGQMPEEKSAADSDFFWIQRTDAASASATAIKVITERLKNRGIEARNCMVVTPQRVGEAGVKSLNVKLQTVLNPQVLGKELTTGKQDPVTWRVDDPIRVTKNDYERLVFNGEIGWIKNVDPEKGTMVATIDDRDVPFEKKHFDTVVHAYAATGHSMQGGQCEAIIVILLREHYNLLSRQWLYTALTRGQKLVVLIGDPGAVRMAISETRREQRNTGLKEKLRAACAPKETPTP